MPIGLRLGKLTKEAEDVSTLFRYRERKTEGSDRIWTTECTNRRPHSHCKSTAVAVFLIAIENHR